eukprot:Skav231929  [mRNA]  locus=scaffold2322:145436:146905:+ [translate_table: standard]
MQHTQHSRHSLLSAHCESKNGRTSEHHTTGPKPQSFEDIGAASYSAIEEDRDLSLHFFHDGRQYIDGGRRAVQLSASMV